MAGRETGEKKTKTKTLQRKSGQNRTLTALQNGKPRRPWVFWLDRALRPLWPAQKPLAGPRSLTLEVPLPGIGVPLKLQDHLYLGAKRSWILFGLRSKFEFWGKAVLLLGYCYSFCWNLLQRGHFSDFLLICNTCWCDGQGMRNGIPRNLRLREPGNELEYLVRNRRQGMRNGMTPRNTIQLAVCFVR